MFSSDVVNSEFLRTDSCLIYERDKFIFGEKSDKIVLLIK